MCMSGCLRKSGEGNRSPGTGVTDDCPGFYYGSEGSERWSSYLLGKCFIQWVIFSDQKHQSFNHPRGKTKNIRHGPGIVGKLNL